MAFPKLMKTARCPTDDLTYTNRAVVNKNDIDPRIRNLQVRTCASHNYVFTIEFHPDVKTGEIAFSLPQRKWASLSIGQQIEVEPYNYPSTQQIGCMTVVADYQKKTSSTSPKDYNTDEMANEFTQQFPRQAFTVGQQLVFRFKNLPLLNLTVKSIEVVDVGVLKGEKKSSNAPSQVRSGMSIPNTQIIFEKSEDSLIKLSGKSKGKSGFQSIINPNWDFKEMGIGGLDKEFSDIFRRAFASRVFPPEFVESLGAKHVKGLLLFGPPGTGKTLMARQIGKMLNAREPQIVNGPEVLNKYVGESEANIRKLFAAAEDEQKQRGTMSGLHIIIFDEIDAICKQRGSATGSTGVHDTVVNQLLSKIDGVEQLNNILLIGMTNRKDLMDEALLRPGRLEVQMEIGLPDEHGRKEIFEIYIRQMRECGKLGSDVDIGELAVMTKNFSGAEIEGLVRAAQSTAMNRLIKASSKIEVQEDAVEKMRVTWTDFLHAFEYDIKPAFGVSEEHFEVYALHGIAEWGQPIRDLMEKGQQIIQQVQHADTQLANLLLHGAPNSGKTALAARLARDTQFPFVKICSAQDMIGFGENAKCQHIKKIFEDAYKSQFSVVVLDDIESLIDYVPIGPRFSNMVLQALMSLLKKHPPKGRKLLIIGTTSVRSVLEEMRMLSAFNPCLYVPKLSHGEEIMAVLEDIDCFEKSEMDQLTKKLTGKKIGIGIKDLYLLIERAKPVSVNKRVPIFLASLEEIEEERKLEEGNKRSKFDL